MMYINNNTASTADRHTHTHTIQKNFFCKLLREDGTQKVDEDADNAALDV
jgi:hypothetical protein